MNIFQNTIEKLPNLSFKQRLSVCIFLLLRMRKDYEKFVLSELGKSDLFDQYKSGIAIAAKVALDEYADSDKLHDLLNEYEKLIPDVDDYSSELTPHAQQSAIALCEVFDFILSTNNEHVINVLNSARDSIDLYIQTSLELDPNREDLDAIIVSHALVKREQKNQNSDLETISDSQKLEDLLRHVISSDWNDWNGILQE